MPDSISPLGLHLAPDGSLSREQYVVRRGTVGGTAGAGTLVGTTVSFSGLGGDVAFEIGLSGFNTLGAPGETSFEVILHDLVSGVDVWGQLLEWHFNEQNVHHYMGRIGALLEGEFGSTYQVRVRPYTVGATVNGQDRVDLFAVCRLPI